jgi:hypothetical protein
MRFGEPPHRLGKRTLFFVQIVDHTRQAHASVYLRALSREAGLTRNYRKIIHL